MANISSSKLQPPFSPRAPPHAPNTPGPGPTTPTSSQDVLDSLPTLAGRGNATFIATDDMTRFLNEDLDLSRLNAIHTHLWMAGRPMRARPLHRYKMYGYDILGTQQMDLHLLRFSNKLLVKPLPAYLLDHDFWITYLCEDTEADRARWETAAGWLLSYVWLLTSPLDFKLAREDALVPPNLDWRAWKAFVASFTAHVDISSLHQVNKRFHFGDLRLARINTIYRTRFFATHFVRGYLYGYNRYVVFFNRNFGWILILFVFLSLVLSAMQVGTALDKLNNDSAFVEGSYGVVVLSMVAVAAVLAIVGVLFVGVFLFNMVDAIGHAKREERRREGLRGEKEGVGKEV
ncbi:hypothetical protein G6514_009687 [Epicoccum nigrum]|nr:hypothetical protein G6514_009687 [Epicoccum nigrum]